LTSGKADASLLEQFRIGKLAPRRELSADHPDKPQVGSDESLPRQRTLIFEQSQLLVRGISETCACHSSIPRQQAGFDRPLQLDNVGVCQQRFMSCIVGELGHAHTLKQWVPLATPSNSKSVDNPLLGALLAHRAGNPTSSSLFAERGVRLCTSTGGCSAHHSSARWRAIPDARRAAGNLSLRRRCCGYVGPYVAPPTPPAQKTSGCTCAVPQPGSYAAAGTSAQRWYG
jgi:hypothetical protein